ncbi:MAG TPA: c-type cytochrome [Chthonomonadaceae bacterium]|nr:c-type cytochrome [Chthonomonadaceae bacterium]
MIRDKRLLPVAALLTAALLTASGVVLNGKVGRAQEVVQQGIPQWAPRPDGVLPADIEGMRTRNVTRIQQAADRFSWQEFVALNWPARADQRGEQDRSQSLSAAATRVWETWKETHEVYLPEGAAPPEWNAPQPIPAGVRTNTPSALSTHLLSATLQATQADGVLPATLTDQHGHLVRYEVRMNRILFDYIRQNRLYDARHLAALDFVSFPYGSMLIKASWRELEPKEEARFLTADAWVADPKEGKPTRWTRKKMGLVGLHIVQKTPSAPEWVWTTFEQVDNLAGPHPSFHPSAASKGPVNLQTRHGVPNQVTRVTLTPKETGGVWHAEDLRYLNHAMQEALAYAHSPLQYYALVDTQWPLQADWSAAYGPGDTLHAEPTFVSNSTMETFTQESSSCMGCHSTARTSRPDRFVSSDFTFTLNNALPQMKNPALIPLPSRPVTAWDKETWRSIVRGRELTQRTYELLPQYVGDKLHCESCHVDGAGNPDSAWWVGMITKYEYPQTDKLQDRIIRCFRRSMNGKPIPTAHGEAEVARQAPEMHAFIAYMQWMDEQYALRSSAPPKTGLYPMPKQAGNAERGKEIFLQKCATCHGKDGKGRYGSDAYYRPALWGPHSFNKGAGLATLPKLIPFIKYNMPLGSGGLLTDQEAWDVGTFLSTQSRPDFAEDGAKP